VQSVDDAIGIACFVADDDVRNRYRCLAEYGIDGRHLRAFKLSADREVGLVEQAIAPYVRRSGSNRDVPGDVTQLVISFHAALVRTAMERNV